MTPYHYTIVRCRDFRVEGEQRNIGLLALSPAGKKAWLRKAVRVSRTGLVGDDADFVDALLDGLYEEATQLARTGDPALVHAWLRERARPSEGTLSFAAPAMGIAPDLDEEIRRLRTKLLGKGGGGTPAVKTLQTRLLRESGYSTAFEPREIPAGPAVWRFSHVADTPTGPLAFVALQLAQKTPGGILDATFRNVGRVSELTRHQPGLTFVGLLQGPGTSGRGAAVERSRELLTEAGVELLPPNVDAVRQTLDRRFGGPHIAQAK